ncbi:cold-shock protein [Roseibium sp.]|uniref:cold-shock protein n=1 Tax=Roseibium sp. TaxID=1936156 RepID=UPI003A97BC24
MHDGDSDRRSRGRRGGKREFGGPQDFGSDFGGGFPDWNSGNQSGYNDGGRDGGYGSDRRGGRREGAGGYGGDSRDGGYGGGNREGGGGYGGQRREGGYGGGASGGGREGGGGYGGGNREGGGGYGGQRREGGYGGGDREGGFRPRPPRPEFDTPAERGPRQAGTVKFFKSDKGFGFITPDNGENDVFVHISAVERSGMTTLESGQRISFETEPDRRGKGPKAVDLQVVEDDGAAPASEAFSNDGSDDAA